MGRRQEPSLAPDPDGLPGHACGLGDRGCRRGGGQRRHSNGRTHALSTTHLSPLEVSCKDPEGSLELMLAHLTISPAITALGLRSRESASGPAPGSKVPPGAGVGGIKPLRRFWAADNMCTIEIRASRHLAWRRRSCGSMRVVLDTCNLAEAERTLILVALTEMGDVEGAAELCGVTGARLRGLLRLHGVEWAGAARVRSTPAPRRTRRTRRTPK